MNKVILMGRLTKKPDVRHTQDGTAIGRYILAVDRRYKKDGGQDADFPSCVVFGKGAEFAEKYFDKGTKIAIEGRIQTGSYKDKNGNTVYTTEVVVEHQEFAESKKSSSEQDGFTNLPQNDDDMPFH